MSDVVYLTIGMYGEEYVEAELAAEYEWETTGRKITDDLASSKSKSFVPSSIKKPIMAIVRKITRKAAGNKTEQDIPKGMNPVDYYLSHDQDLRNYLAEYFQYSVAISDPEIRKTLDGIKESGTATEKLQAVSLLGTIKLFYS